MMLKWLKNLSSVCKHKWEIMEERNIAIYGTLDGKHLTNNPSSRKKVVMLRCKKCGDVKVKTWEY